MASLHLLLQEWLKPCIQPAWTAAFMSVASRSRQALSTNVSAGDRGSCPPAQAGGSLQSLGHEADPAVVGHKLKAAAPHDAGMIEIDARIIAEGLGIAPEDVEPARHAGTVTTLCERGTDEDAGLVRVTFYFGKRRLRLLVDAHGTVLQQPAPDQPKG